jgi:hypothetical protein
MEEKIDKIHQLIKEIFEETTAVRIFVNSTGIEVSPEYRTNTSGYSMQNITGEWVKRSE